MPVRDRVAHRLHLALLLGMTVARAMWNACMEEPPLFQAVTRTPPHISPQGPWRGLDARPEAPAEAGPSARALPRSPSAGAPPRASRGAKRRPASVCTPPPTHHPSLRPNTAPRCALSRCALSTRPWPLSAGSGAVRKRPTAQHDPKGPVDGRSTFQGEPGGRP